MNKILLLIPSVAAQIKDAFVKERMNRWRLEAETLDEQGLLEKMTQMTFYSPLSPQPGLIIPNLHGGYEYIPLERGDVLRPNIPEDHMAKINQLRLFHNNPSNAQVIKEVEKEMDKEIEEKCFWEFLDDGDASGMGFLTKVR